MTAQVSTQAITQAKSRTSVLAKNLAALAFGIVILFAVGFAPLEAAHNVHHTMAFPCH